MTYGDEGDHAMERLREWREDRVAELAKDSGGCCRLSEPCVHELARMVIRERRRTTVAAQEGRA